MGGPGSGPRPVPHPATAQHHRAALALVTERYQAAAAAQEAGIRQALADGMHLIEVADLVGCSPMTVQAIRERPPAERYGMPKVPVQDRCRAPAARGGA